MDAASLTVDAFDGSAEPIVYMSDNRMPVMIEFNSTIIYIIFAALLLALLFILPGVRKTKLTSFLGLLTLLIVGASILLALEGSNWLTGSVQINDAPYSSLSSATINGRLEVNIGLKWANVTLAGKLVDDQETGQDRMSSSKPVDYNERFQWDEPENMAREHLQALRRGLPYPILTVTEFLSQDSDGFNWSRQLRQAGYYSALTLYLALASWCLTLIIVCVLPHYLPHMMQITGSIMMASVWIYTLMIRSPQSFAFQLGGAGQPIEFAFGLTYVSTFAAGAISVFMGVLIYVIQMSKPHERLTIMDSDQYVNDQKTLYSANLFAHSNSRLGLVNNADKQEQKPGKSTKVLNRTDSVIIPMADIEENFKPIARE